MFCKKVSDIYIISKHLYLIIIYFKVDWTLKNVVKKIYFWKYHNFEHNLFHTSTEIKIFDTNRSNGKLASFVVKQFFLKRQTKLSFQTKLIHIEVDTFYMTSQILVLASFIGFSTLF